MGSIETRDCTEYSKVVMPDTDPASRNIYRSIDWIPVFIT
jgi:hypothetical protein